MKLGIISDVHGNFPALEAVLEDMPQVSRLICLGDIVGYNPFPAECLHRVRERCDLVLQGNHDRLELEGLNRQAIAGIQFAKSELSHEQQEYLQQLPGKCEVWDTGLLAVHSHPENVDQYVMPRNFPRMRPYLDEYKGLLLGHTHVQHVAEIDNRLILNPGSVGQPRDGDSRAAYAVIDTEPLDYDLRRVEYDTGRILQTVLDSELPDEIGFRLLDGL
jgi:putative phosphoesterase